VLVVCHVSFLLSVSAVDGLDFSWLGSLQWYPSFLSRRSRFVHHPKLVFCTGFGCFRFYCNFLGGERRHGPGIRHRRLRFGDGTTPGSPNSGTGEMLSMPRGDGFLQLITAKFLQLLESFFNADPGDPTICYTTFGMRTLQALPPRFRQLIRSARPLSLRLRVRCYSDNFLFSLPPIDTITSTTPYVDFSAFFPNVPEVFALRVS